jgi:short-subunit dehydrogenase
MEQDMSGEAGTVVVTGASAGVGRAVASAFARHGWNVALIARERRGLEGTAQEVERAGGKALILSADVADAAAIFACADRVIERFATIDVWVNNAMVTMFAPVTGASAEEFRRITEVNYLGCVYGTMAALAHMRARNAGTIVQVGSALAYRAIPLQAAYCGSKFASRGFTEALRCELQHENSNIRVTMVQLPAVNTPQFDWARNKMPGRPQPIPPIHQPEPIAEAIFRASQNAPRETWIGFASVRAILGTMIAPGLLDRLLAKKGYAGQIAAEPPASGQSDNLSAPVASGHRTHGRFDDRARNWAPAFNPAVVRAAAAALSGMLLVLVGAALTLLLVA